MAERLTPEQLHERDRLYVERIINDDNFAYFFFYHKCYNLFRKIQWTIFGNDADYDELINSFYLYLKQPDKENGEEWHKLRTFDYRTSLFDWVKTVAVRFFYAPCSDKLVITDEVIDSGMLEEMVAELKAPDVRKYFWFYYVKKLTKSEINSLLGLNANQLRLLIRRAEVAFRHLVKQKYPGYYSRLFVKDDIQFVDVSKASNISSDEDVSVALNNLEIHDLVARMPNQRYREVIQSLFFKDESPDTLAERLHIRVSNVYNLKSRAIEQLRDILIYTPGEIDLDYYINRINDDRLREVAHSIFNKHMEYDDIATRLELSNKEFKRLKCAAMKELKALIFC